MTAPDGTDVFIRPQGGVPVPAGGVLRGADPHLDGTVEEAIRAGLEVTELPFGVVEIVVVSGLGAGIVHRLEVGRHRCGGDAEADVPLPTRATWWVDVRCGGDVRLESAESDAGAESDESDAGTDDEEPRAERDSHDVVLDVVLDDVVADDGGPGDGRSDDEPEREPDPSPERDARAWSKPWPVGERRRVGGLELLLRWCAGPAEALRPVAGLPLADVLLDRVSGSEAPRSDAAPGERFTWELGRAGEEVVSVDLAAEPVLTVIGEHRHAFARALLGRLIASWGPDRLRLTLLAPGVVEGRSEWAWMRWLPHARCHDERFVRAGFDDAACARLVGEIAAAPGGSVDVVVVDGAAGDPRRIARPGLAVLVLGERAGVGPVVEVAGPRAHVRGLVGVGDVDVDLPALEWSERLARTTAVTEHGRVVSGGRLAELLEVEPDDADAVVGRWAGRPSTRVPVGWVVDAGLEGAATVDLRTDGPHALVGGTTGSGKSELLQTLVASLAAVNPPEAMSFLLVDYKGGAAFAECARLPHTVGLVTDLDHGLTQRALSSLTAEVRRRERLLAEAGVTDLDDYLATGQGELARLVIVVDEFATLAAELPEFVDGVVDIARRGRSLGLHLVLATQRPAGAVSPDIRANTTLRISLRVAEAADSVDVIGEPDAAAIDEKEPGRALVRVGRKPLVTIQAARVTLPGPTSVPHGTPYVFGEPVEELAARSDLARMVDTMRSVATSRGVPLPPSPWLPPLPPRLGLDVLDAELGSGGSAAADTGHATTGTGDQGSGTGLRARNLFRRPNPQVRDPEDMVVPFGLEDRPAEQRRAVATLRLNEGVPLAIIGAARSGRTGALSAVAASVARRFAPTEVQVYAIDAGARALGDLEESPNVGAVVFRDELDRLGRLVMRLAEELDRRIQTLALHRRRDIAAQREAEPDAPWPYMVVLIDRWDLLTEEAEVSDDRTLVSTLERLVTEGGRAGILVVVTGDRSMLTGRATALFPDRLVLRLADAYDYVSAGLSGPPGRGEPGRGWRTPEGVETQVAEAGVDAVGDAEGEAGVSDRVVPWSRGGPFRIDRLPVLVTRDDVTELVEAMALERTETRSADVPVGLGEPVEGRSGSAGALLVAVGGDELGPRSIDVDEHGPCALVTGRRRTGRSGVLVAMVESALEGGWEVAVVTARRSPLTRLPAVYPRVHGPFRHDEDAAELAEVVRRALREGGRLLVVADDVDLLPEGALADELASLPQRMRDTGSFFVGSGEAEEILASFRGPAPSLRRARCGVMLAPQGIEEGDAFGVRLRRGQYGRALGVGAGYLVLDGLAERVQVVRSDLLPAPGL